MMLLTDEEKSIYELYGTEGLAGYNMDGLLKAQLRKVYEWGNEECPHKWEDFYSGEKRPRSTRQCPKCWQAILEEILEGR